MELVARAIVPAADEKHIVHEAILELITSDLPPWMSFDLEDPDLTYQIYPQKFLGETWEALRETELARQEGPGQLDDYVMGQWLGLTMMSELAAVCAGSQKQMITDRIDAYAALGRLAAAGDPDGEYGGNDPDVHRLITRSLQLVDPRKADLGRLVELRKREEAGSDTLLAELRSGYAASVARAIDALENDAKTERDAQEIEREFVSEMERDLSELKRALRLDAGVALMTKPVLLGIGVGAGALVVPWLSGAVQVASLAGLGLAYGEKRRRRLKRHPMSWLYLPDSRVQLI